VVKKPWGLPITIGPGGSRESIFNQRGGTPREPKSTGAPQQTLSLTKGERDLISQKNSGDVGRKQVTGRESQEAGRGGQESAK